MTKKKPARKSSEKGKDGLTARKTISIGKENEKDEKFDSHNSGKKPH